MENETEVQTQNESEPIFTAEQEQRIKEIVFQIIERALMQQTRNHV
jgi:hypothetical protein